MSSALPPAAPQAIGVLYAERLTSLRAEEGILERDHRRLGYLRLLFGVAVVPFLIPPTPLALAPLAGFALAAREHGHILDRLAAVRRSLAFYTRATARLEDRWADLPAPATPFDPAASLFAEDLDLFGPASLFALLCETRTSLGRLTLAQWLLSPAPIPVLQDRHEALAELRAHLPLREAFAAAPGPPEATLDREALVAWSTAPLPTVPAALSWLAPLLVLLTLLAACHYAVTHSPLLFTLALLLDAVITFRLRHVTRTLMLEAERASKALRTAGALLKTLEAAPFTSASILRRLDALQTAHHSSAQAIVQLQRLGIWAEARSNYLLRLLDAPLLYSVQIGAALARWRSRFGAHLPHWLDTLGEMEALLSLAAYSAEHPHDPFPELIDAADGEAVFAARGLGHPLLPAASCVRNDLQLGPQTRLLLISGSNMSGKSTLLRSVGINAVLAFAGAPVRAENLRLSPLTLGASIHTNDSLQAGRSRFYAEILRLRTITEQAHHQPPTLFLVDELLAGTNSSDRLAGARGLAQAWLASGALGLLSTHDLALTALADELGATTRNVHLQDEVREGKLHFDYKLREGPVTRSNGLALMRLIGLDV